MDNLELIILKYWFRVKTSAQPKLQLQLGRVKHYSHTGAYMLLQHEYMLLQHEHMLLQHGYMLLQHEYMLLQHFIPGKVPEKHEFWIKS